MKPKYDRTRVRPPEAQSGHRFHVDLIFPDTVKVIIAKRGAARSVLEPRFPPVEAFNLGVALVAAALDKPAADVAAALDATYVLNTENLEDNP